MSFIVSGLLLWLAIAIVTGASALTLQIRRMKDLVNFESDFSDFFEGVGLIVFLGFISSVSGILFLVAVAGTLLA